MSNVVDSAIAAGKKIFLNVGCGHLDSAPLPVWSRSPEWQEIRLDIDAGVQPDIVASITDMKGAVADGTVDALWSSHNIEHLFEHEVDLALAEFARVLKPDGVAHVFVPDLQCLAAMIAEGRLIDTLYVSPGGPIRPLDMIYGHASSIAKGRTYMAHRTGFTSTSLRRALVRAGLTYTDVEQKDFQLIAVAAKTNVWSAALTG